MKLALRTQILLKLSHASTLSIWNNEIQAKVNSKGRKQQYTVKLFDYNHLAHLIALWQTQNVCVTVQFLLRGAI